MFTQFDLLASTVVLRMNGDRPTDGEIQKRVSEIFEKKTVAPFEQLTQAIPGGVPFVHVSSMSSSLGSGVKLPLC